MKIRKNHDGIEGKDSLPYNALLKNELLGAEIEDLRDSPEERRALSPVQSPRLYKVKFSVFFLYFHIYFTHQLLLFSTCESFFYFHLEFSKKLYVILRNL